jgi:glycerol-3-phosphate dehydrogenase
VSPDLLAETGLNRETQRRLIGRYGSAAADLVAGAPPEERETIPGTKTLWAELRWACRNEGVVRLEDLLLRRVRIGLLLPYGGAEFLERIREICRKELGWEEARWREEERAYLELWKRCYSLPPREEIPDWKELLGRAVRDREERRRVRRRRRIRRAVLAGIAVGAAVGLTACYLRRKRRRDDEED